MLLSVYPYMRANAVEEEYDLPWLWPVPLSYKINCLDYYYDGDIHQKGQSIDIGSNGYFREDNRLDIISATSGTVLYIQDKYNETDNRGSGFGNYVIVQSGNVNIIYAHLKTISCEYGEIKAGDVIGKMGNTGKSTGVHLHMQVYPSNSTSSNADIWVFEKYRENPLYYEKFEFMKGLKTYSVRYGDWISDYYKTLSSSYYKYSGGIDIGFPVTSLSASVTVVNTSGATVRTLPVSDNTYVTSTVSHGNRVSITAYYYDAHGELWLNKAEGGWLKATDVGFYDYIFTSQLENAEYPAGEYGAYNELPFSGNIVSQNPINNFTAEIRKGETAIASYTHEAGGYTVPIASIYEGLGITDLANGIYSFVLYATETPVYPGASPAYNTRVLVTSQFSINESLSDKTPPVIERFEISSVTEDAVNVYVTASDDREIKEVGINAESGGEKYSFNCVSKNGRYECSIPLSELGKGSMYTLTATVYDGYRNTDSVSRDVTVPKTGLSETWKATDAIKIRPDPGTADGNDKIGTVTKGSTFTITEAVIADGYYWGHHSKGWSSLGEVDGEMYAELVSGNLYSVIFDLNGGKGSISSPVPKNYNAVLTIPETIPTRTGYKFLGWARASDAKTAEYTAGDSYTGNASVTLFAVWEDKTVPTIGSVAISSSAWTNQSVSVKVTASDNTGKVFYSFDGGAKWQASPSKAYTENTVIPLRSIAVKDASGNITYYTKEIKITSIDKTPPSLENVKPEISVSGTSVIFTFSGVSDSESGVSVTEAVVSSHRDMSAPVTFTVKSGKATTLSNGVYYWSLKVTDNAGNVTEKSFGRFRVGENERLPVPTEVKIVSTSSVETVISWNSNEHADGYRIELSQKSDFSDVITRNSDSAEYTVTGLAVGKTYFVRVFAYSNDGIYLTSNASKSVEFVTLSGDVDIYGFESMTDAEIDLDKNDIIYTAPYAAGSVDITATVHSGTKVEYFTDSLLKNKISNITAYPFSGKTVNAYMKVTAENGDTATYVLTVTRAAESAAVPTVDYKFTDSEITVGEKSNGLKVSASSSDGGRIAVTWYMSYNGSAPQRIGEGESIAPDCPIAGQYSVYAVVENINDKCQTKVKSITTDPVMITVKKLTSPISVSCQGFVYNGKTPEPKSSGYIGDGRISFRYYTDEKLEKQVETPTSAGTYYVVAAASETAKYSASLSSPVKIVIEKAERTDKLTVNVVPPTRDQVNGFISTECEDVEYRAVGTDKWLPVGTDRISIAGGTKLEIRFKETENYKAGEKTTFEMKAFDGALSIDPKEASEMFVEDGYLFIDASALTAKDILSRLEKTGGVNIYARDGELLNKTSDLVGTGAQIRIEEGEIVYESLEIIVIADVDGDGKVTSADAADIMKLSNGMISSNDELVMIAADVDGDGKITSADAYLALIKE